MNPAPRNHSIVTNHLEHKSNILAFTMRVQNTKKACIDAGRGGKEESQSSSVDSLLDISSRNVAQYIPFQYIEERYHCRIPGK